MGINRSLTPMIGVATLLVVVIVLSGLSGCGLILDLDPWPPDPADAGAGDGGGLDAEADSRIVDAFLSDAPADASTDADLDAWVVEIDAGSDEDASPADAGLDAAVSDVPCADDTVDQLYPDQPNIVGCDGARDQCSAEMLCGSGWHLCTWSEFVGRGGDTVVSTTIRWLASCARLPGTCVVPARPTDAICSPFCSRAGDTVVTIGRVCGGSVIGEGDCPLGVAAYTLPMGATFGTDTTCALARADWTTRAYGATCCR